MVRRSAESTILSDLKTHERSMGCPGAHSSAPTVLGQGWAAGGSGGAAFLFLRLREVDLQQMLFSSLLEFLGAGAG